MKSNKENKAGEPEQLYQIKISKINDDTFGEKTHIAESFVSVLVSDSPINPDNDRLQVIIAGSPEITNILQALIGSLFRVHGHKETLESLKEAVIQAESSYTLNQFHDLLMQAMGK